VVELADSSRARPARLPRYEIAPGLLLLPSAAGSVLPTPWRRSISPPVGQLSFNGHPTRANTPLHWPWPLPAGRSAHHAA